MEHAGSLHVDASTGTPAWGPDEISYRLCARVDAWDEKAQAKVVRGATLAVTSHRLALLDEQGAFFSRLTAAATAVTGPKGGGGSVAAKVERLNASLAPGGNAMGCSPMTTAASWTI